MSELLDPSKKLRALVGKFPTVNAAAREWKIGRNSLERFMNGDGMPSMRTVRRLQAATGLKYAQLFNYGDDE